MNPYDVPAVRFCGKREAERRRKAAQAARRAYRRLYPARNMDIETALYVAPEDQRPRLPGDLH